MRKSLILALSVVCLTVPAWTAKKKAEVDAKRFQEKLTKDQQILHTLDRLTYGPRPGDVDAVKKMGLKKWIDQQLHPEKINDDAWLPSSGVFDVHVQFSKLMKDSSYDESRDSNYRKFEANSTVVDAH